MPRKDDAEQRLLEAVLRAQKDKLSVEGFVTVANVLAEAGRNRLLTQIAWFLMATLAVTLLLLILHSVSLVHLPSGIIDKLSILFGVEIVTLLGVIVRDLTKSKK
jgi:FtsH-binding integral membrane protein